jgi:hypothetical protein
LQRPPNLKALERDALARAPSQYHAHGLWDKRDGTDDGDDLQAFFEPEEFVRVFDQV